MTEEVLSQDEVENLLKAREAAQAEAALADAVGALLDAEGDLPALLPRLCTDIDAGRFDSPERQAALRAVLKDITRARLAVSNPKRLAADAPKPETSGSGR